MCDDDDARMKRVQELLDTLQLPDLSGELRAKLERELACIGRILDSSLVPVIVYSEVEGLVDYLLQRQGSVVPDFDAIRKRKAELDRRFFKGDSP
jgi:hypothetical protein